MDFVIPIQSDSLFFQPVGYRNNINTQHRITLDLEMTGDSSGNIDSTDEISFSTRLRDILVIDRLSDVYITGITTSNTKLNTSSANANFILKINEFNVHTNTNQSGLVSKIIIPNNATAKGVANHKSNKLSYMCTLNPSMLLNLSGSITMNDESTILIDDLAYVEREGSRYSAARDPQTGIVLHKAHTGGVGSSTHGGGPPWFVHARQYDNTVVAATGTTPATITGDTAYSTVSRSIVVLRDTDGKHIDETDENGVRGIEPGEMLYTKQYLGGGPKRHDQLTHATDDRDLVNDYNSDGTVDYDYTQSTWVGSAGGKYEYHVAGSEFRSIGQVFTVGNYTDSPALFGGNPGKIITFMWNTDNDGDASVNDAYYDAKYGNDRGNIVLAAAGGSSIWIENRDRATTFRCIIELVIISRREHKEKD